MSSEFELISRLVRAWPARRADVLAGPGDDGAILRPPAGMDLVQTVDTCLEGVHFPSGLAPEDIGWRSLAVNLSDLAAMGAEPAWALLSLAWPRADEGWLAGFARGVTELASETGMEVVGGDMVRGPLAVTFALTGFVPAGTALRRNGARPGDGIWVTGPLGGGAGGLAAWQHGDRAAATPLLRPQPRLAEGRALRGVASAAIDVSDGLLQDLGHVLEASGVGAVLDLDAVPVHAVAGPGEAGLARALNGGDDYVLCFTVPPDRTAALERCAARWERAPVQIGTVVGGAGLEGRRAGAAVALPAAGWDPFRTPTP